MSYQEYIEILWIRIVLQGIGVVVSLTTQAAALITFGKWGLRKYQASHLPPPKNRSNARNKRTQQLKDFLALIWRQWSFWHL